MSEAKLLALWPDLRDPSQGPLDRSHDRQDRLLGLGGAVPDRTNLKFKGANNAFANYFDQPDAGQARDL